MQKTKQDITNIYQPSADLIFKYQHRHQLLKNSHQTTTAFCFLYNNYIYFKRAVVELFIFQNSKALHILEDQGLQWGNRLKLCFWQIAPDRDVIAVQLQSQRRMFCCCFFRHHPLGPISAETALIITSTVTLNNKKMSLSQLIVSVQDTDSLLTPRQTHWYGSVSPLSTHSLSSGHYRLLLSPFPWQQHDWCLLLAISPNSLEANLNWPLLCGSGLKTDNVVIIKKVDILHQRWLVSIHVFFSPISRKLSCHSATDRGLGIKGYCSPDTQAAVRYVPSCWPLSEQCQLKFLSWPVLSSHSISNTNSTTVTLAWWAVKKQHHTNT